MILFRNENGQNPEWKNFGTECLTATALATAEKIVEKVDETINSKDDQIKELQDEVKNLKEKMAENDKKMTENDKKLDALRKDFDLFRKDFSFPKYHATRNCPGTLTWDAGTVCEKCE